jgi:hypothetical protein
MHTPRVREKIKLVDVSTRVRKLDVGKESSRPHDLLKSICVTRHLSVSMWRRPCIFSPAALYQAYTVPGWIILAFKVPTIKPRHKRTYYYVLQII